LQRFFSAMRVPDQTLAKLLMIFFFAEDDEKLYLSLDRTNWNWGQKPINLLVLSACYQGMAIPLFWVSLDKKGNSDTNERIQLMNTFIECFGVNRIASLLADREFVGEIWFKYLFEKDIPFDIRIKKNNITTNSRGIKVTVAGLLRHLSVGETCILLGKRKLMGQMVCLSALRLKDGKLLIIASSHASEQAMQRYARRWEIETLFSCLKGRGFRFEETRITHTERIETLFMVLALTAAWAHAIGDWRNSEQKAIVRKKHGRLTQSYFRYGLDWLRQAIHARHSQRRQQWRQVVLRFKKTVSQCLNQIKNQLTSQANQAIQVSER